MHLYDTLTQLFLRCLQEWLQQLTCQASIGSLPHREQGSTMCGSSFCLSLPHKKAANRHLPNRVGSPSGETHSTSYMNVPSLQDLNLLELHAVHKHANGSFHSFKPGMPKSWQTAWQQGSGSKIHFSLHRSSQPLELVFNIRSLSQKLTSQRYTTHQQTALAGITARTANGNYMIRCYRTHSDSGVLIFGPLCISRKQEMSCLLFQGGSRSGLHKGCISSSMVGTTDIHLYILSPVSLSSEEDQVSGSVNDLDCF